MLIIAVQIYAQIVPVSKGLFGTNGTFNSFYYDATYIVHSETPMSGFPYSKYTSYQTCVSGTMVSRPMYVYGNCSIVTTEYQRPTIVAACKTSGSSTTTIGLSLYKTNALPSCVMTCVQRGLDATQDKIQAENDCRVFGGVPEYTIDPFVCNVTGSCNYGELPSCLSASAYASSLCKGGKAYYYAGSGPSVANSISGDNYGPEGTLQYEYLMGDPETVRRPDGSECTMYNTGSGMQVKVSVCPLGWSENACKIKPSLEHCKSTSSSSAGASSGTSSGDLSSSSSQGNYSDGSAEEDICEKYPDLPMCQADYGSSASGGNSSGVSCADLGNCDWSTLEIQIKELGTAISTDNGVKEAVELLKDGYALDVDQLQALGQIRDAINGGNAQEGDGAGDGILDLLGDLAGDKEGGIDQTGNNELADELELKTGGQFETKAEELLDKNVNDYDGESVLLQTQTLIEPNFEPLTEYLEQYPKSDLKIDMTFDSGVMGIKCTSCVIDLRNIHGFDLKAVVDGLLKLIAVIGAVIMVMRAVRTGGHS